MITLADIARDDQQDIMSVKSTTLKVKQDKRAKGRPTRIS